MPVSWVFFDIGDVLFDEDVPHLYYFHSLLLALRRNGIDVGWDDYYARLRELARDKPATAPLDAAASYARDPDQAEKVLSEGRAEYLEMRKPRPYGLLRDNIAGVLEGLSREFRLGIIANQHPPILKALDDYGIGGYFQVKVIDEVVGVSKPDPAIFRLALEQAGCRAQEAIMVGDRPDNDVAPAKALGMSTIRFRRGVLYVYYDARSTEERADLEVYDLIRLAPAIRQLASASR